MRKPFIGLERDLICIKYVICTIFSQLELCFHSVRHIAEYSHIFKNYVILRFCWVKQADSPQVALMPV